MKFSYVKYLCEHEQTLNRYQLDVLDILDKHSKGKYDFKYTKELVLDCLYDCWLKWYDGNDFGKEYNNDFDEFKKVALSDTNSAQDEDALAALAAEFMDDPRV